MTQTEWPTERESGASLIIALIFVVAIALIILALIDLTGTNLIDTGNLQNQRSLEYSADSAVDGAIQLVRTGAATCSNSSTVFEPATLVNGYDVRAFCSLDSNTGTLRVVTFYACQASSGTLTSCATNNLIDANITFIDQNCATPISCTTSTGYSLQINSWVVNRANE